ncbi:MULTISPECIES: hypothetical protein [unclassified Microcoleus]|uniref:hypothetical protein n=1 Tax=unclassified Microcoleus TaxID=2642155 RepID=UPI002FD0F3EC
MVEFIMECDRSFWGRETALPSPPILGVGKRHCRVLRRLDLARFSSIALLLQYLLLFLRLSILNSAKTYQGLGRSSEFIH